MQNVVIRIAVALTGLLLLLIGIGAWIDPVKTGGSLGLSGAPGLGMATLRADLGAFFVGGGGLAIAAAGWRDRGLLTAPVLLIGLALSGRFLAMAVTPFDRAMVPPMVAEAVMLAVFATGRFRRAA
jgi:hypothetical protein